MVVTLGVRQRVVAFEFPGAEHQALRAMKRSVQRELQLPKHIICGSIPITNLHLYQLLTFLVSSKASATLAYEQEQLVKASLQHFQLTKQHLPTPNDWSYHSNSTSSYITVNNDAQNDSPHYLILLIYRPEPLLPFCMASARRAVRFVHGVVALVTANAYISTLGGGHFLCKHLNQAKLMAKMQIAVSMGLQDPVLESKCRINLSYNAIQAGKFRHALRMIENEAAIAEELQNEELEKVCYAAKVYLMKTYRLHKEFKQKNAEFYHKKERVVDNFYRQRIVRAAK